MASVLKGVMHPTLVRSTRKFAAFTMVELAICIAVVAVAMVAILGVLPAGHGAQQLNREETIINQDATVLLEVIRTGAVLSDDLINYVDYITVERHPYAPDDAGRPTTNGFSGVWFSSSKVPAPATQLLNSSNIVGLLSLPKYDGIRQYDAYADSRVPGIGYTNIVTAQWRAFSGPLNEKPFLTKTAVPTPGTYDSSFRYLVRVEISPVRTGPLVVTNRVALTNSIYSLWTHENVVRHSLYDVSLTFQWPVFGNEIPARVGANSRTVRTQVQGRLIPFYPNGTQKPPYTLPNSTVVPRYFVTTNASASVKYP